VQSQTIKAIRLNPEIPSFIPEGTGKSGIRANQTAIRDFTRTLESILNMLMHIIIEDSKNKLGSIGKCLLIWKSR